MAESRPVNIDLDEEVATGTYSNFTVISHSPAEFILDFAAMMPGIERPRVRSRIILAPEHAKRLLLSLKENIVRYENLHGPIEIPAIQAEEIAAARRCGEA